MTGADRVYLLVNVQEWWCFSIFRRAEDVTRTMSKGGGGCVLVNVLKAEGDDVTRHKLQAINMYSI